jgi:hypothetical protein
MAGVPGDSIVPVTPVYAAQRSSGKVEASVDRSLIDTVWE